MRRLEELERELNRIEYEELKLKEKRGELTDEERKRLEELDKFFNDDSGLTEEIKSRNTEEFVEMPEVIVMNNAEEDKKEEEMKK